MTREEYSDVLRKATARLSALTTDVTVNGEGPARFLVASLDGLGVEFYAADNGFVVDPALRDELQGEKFFPTADAALSFATDWLTQKP